MKALWNEIIKDDDSSDFFAGRVNVSLNVFTETAINKPDTLQLRTLCEVAMSDVYPGDEPQKHFKELTESTKLRQKSKWLMHRGRLANIPHLRATLSSRRCNHFEIDRADAS